MTCGLILLIKWVVPEFICNLTGSTSEEGTGKQSQQKTRVEGILVEKGSVSKSQQNKRNRITPGEMSTTKQDESALVPSSSSVQFSPVTGPVVKTT